MLDRRGFSQVTFRGEYPIGLVSYGDNGCAVTVALEAFSPFVPLNEQDSSLPATVLRYTVKNVSGQRVEAEVGGWLENAVCLHSAQVGIGVRHNRMVREGRVTMLECGASAPPAEKQTQARPEIVFEDFEKPTYEGWTATGTAFGSGPVEKGKMPQYQGDVGAAGNRLVNTHNARQGEDVGAGDKHTGTLTSKVFVMERNHINFLIGGGGHQRRTCMNLLIEGKVVLSATGRNDNRMQAGSFDVRAWAGQRGQLQIVDSETGPWGNIGIDQIVFSDRPARPPIKFDQQHDHGTMALAVIGGGEGVASCQLPEGATGNWQLITGNSLVESASQPFGKKLVGAVAKKLTLEAGQEAAVTFVVAWHFPNLNLKDGGRHYATRFESAGVVARHVAENIEALSKQTRLWRDTWYDSTLPYWFLDRTFANTSTLATSTCHWFKTGRFYGWEGVGCCEGTCTHVWGYAHAVARLFPELERILREKVDFDIAFDPKTGMINHRGESHGPAIDGQAGCVLRAYREHQMSADDAFLKRNWPRVKKALEYLMEQDGNGDGILEGGQHNTLDSAWFGPVAWLSGLYLAALRAGEEMAGEMGDEDFARQTRGIFEKGKKRIVELLFNGEYFIHKPDPKHPEAMRSADGCEIDQVFGQSWAFAVGLGRIFEEEQAKSALRALWKYNFTPDVGPYREANKPGRWYAMAGEGGLIMCTFPRGGEKFDKGYAYYLNECMTGFEYQVAGHMIWEGMVMEGLAVARMIHDRYHAARRNPWNEVECGDHYARAMASYGVYLAACGFEYHGPQGRLGFSPKIRPEDFKAAFTTAQGWGTFWQKREGDEQRVGIDLKYGVLRVGSLALGLPEGKTVKEVQVVVDGRGVECTHLAAANRVDLTMAAVIGIQAGQRIEVRVRLG
jgi:uncharacterized protein (DUF608 family)